MQREIAPSDREVVEALVGLNTSVQETLETLWYTVARSPFRSADLQNRARGIALRIAPACPTWLLPMLRMARNEHVGWLYGRLKELAISGPETEYQEALTELRTLQQEEAAAMAEHARQRDHLRDDDIERAPRTTRELIRKYEGTPH
jgi:hypothetical protein